MSTMLSVRAIAAPLLCILLAPGAGAQNSGTPADKAEVVHVDGKDLTLRFTDGQTRQFEIPASAEFTIDGKPVHMPGLKPGMKLTATISTVTVPSWIDTVETIDVGTVWKTVGSSLIVKTPEGENRIYRLPPGGKISIGGVEKSLDQLREGDKITASVLKTREHTKFAAESGSVHHTPAMPAVLRTPPVVEGTGSEESRWPWIISAILAVIIIVLVTVLVVRGARERQKA